MRRVHQLLTAGALIFGLGACASFPEPPPARDTDGNIHQQLVNEAQALVGQPYRYGGAAPGGFDCSGLVYYAYRQVGIQVPRTTRQQYRYADRVHMAHLRPGDLVFFRLQGSTVSHVGLYIGDGRMVHAPSTGSRVRVDTMREGFWRTRYAGSARLLGEPATENGPGGLLSW